MNLVLPALNISTIVPCSVAEAVSSDEGRVTDLDDDDER